jgi:hypothetical protein
LLLRVPFASARVVSSLGRADLTGRGQHYSVLLQNEISTLAPDLIVAAFPLPQ